MALTSFSKLAILARGRAVPAKDAVLHIEVASHVSGRVADDDDVAVEQVLRRADGEWQSTA